MGLLKVVEQSSWITINGRSVPFAAFIAFEAAAALLCLGLALVCVRATVMAWRKKTKQGAWG